MIKFDFLKNYIAQEDFFCVCLGRASDRRNNIKSSKAYFIETYLEKRFRKSPISGNVNKDEPFMLECKPPYGQPRPKVTWLKNNEPIDFGVEDPVSLGDSQQRHYQLIETTNLMIARATLQDA